RRARAPATTPRVHTWVHRGPGAAPQGLTKETIMAVDFFLKLEGPDVEGESMDSQHTDEIAISSWSWGMNQSGTMHLAKGGGAGKVDVHDISFTKLVDKATPNLMQHCCKGTQFDTATLVCRKASGDGGQLEYL